MTYTHIIIPNKFYSYKNNESIVNRTPVSRTLALDLIVSVIELIYILYVTNNPESIFKQHTRTVGVYNLHWNYKIKLENINRLNSLLCQGCLRVGMKTDTA